MNLEEWRKQRQAGEEAELPSGLVVRIRKVSLMDLAEQGQIPQTLVPKINELMKGKGGNSVDEVKEASGLVNVVCRACIVEPAGLQVEELPYEDRLAIFTWASAVATKLKPFRREATEPVGA